MTPDDRTRTQDPNPPTQSFDAALDAGLAAAFGSDLTPGGWSQPPLLRDDPSSHAPLVQPSSPEMPRGTDDRYQLLGEIARGGMGVVLKGRDPDLGRDLAFKVLRSELAHKPAAVQRFVEEAQVGGQLQHPGVVPVYDIGRFADGRPYFAMKLVKGRTLADLLAERESPSDARGRFLQHFLQVCQTVAYAHSKGVIHRDLKPSNVMVGGFGEVLVMDWGLAKVLPRGGVADEIKASREREQPEEFTEIKTARFGSGSETAAGSVLGTPAFMPPEQAGGEIDKLDERADVFGLGAVLCVILTGKPPFVAGTADAVRLMAVRGDLDDAFARLDECGADAEVVALCKRCLAAKREHRLRDAGEVAAAVAAHLSSVEQRARDAEINRERAEVRHAEERKRRRVQGALGVALMAAVGLVGFGLWWQERAAAAASADRAARQARTVSSTTAALDDARTRAEEAWGEAGTADRMKTAANLATAAVRRAEGFVNTGEPTGELRAELEAVQSAVEDLNRHVRLLEEAERIILNRVEFVASSDPNRALSPERFAAAFRAFGIDVTAGPEAEVVTAINRSRMRGRLVGLLSAWHYRSKDDAERTRLADVMRAANRAAGGVSARWQDLADRGDVPGLVALAASPEVLSLAPELIGSVGTRLGAAGEHRARLDLLRRACARYPNHANLHANLVTVCYAQTPPLNAEALRHASAMVHVYPLHPGNWRELGYAYQRNQAPVQAIAAYRRAIDLGLKFPSWTYGQLGAALRQTGDFPRAIDAFRTALELNPGDAFAHANLAAALYHTNDYAGALPHYRRSVELAPRIAAYHAGLGGGLRATGDLAGAANSYREAIRLDPKHTFPHNALAWLRATGPDGMRDGKEAVKLATQACELSGRADPACLDTLAAAYAESGDFEKAVEFQKRALFFPAFEKSDGPKARERLTLYGQGKPYRDPKLLPREVAPPPRPVKRWPS